MSDKLKFKVIYAHDMGFELVPREVYSILLQPGSLMGRGKTLRTVVDMRVGDPVARWKVYRAPTLWNDPPRRVDVEGIAAAETYASGASRAVIASWVERGCSDSVVALCAAFRWPHLIPDDRRFLADPASDAIGAELLKAFNVKRTSTPNIDPDERPRRRMASR